MKKLLSILTTVAVICCLLGVSAAADASAKVYVTVANGGLELANSEVTVTDIDGDGALTINDALYAAHESYFKGGAAAGYASEMSDYGLMLTKLWGIENGGSYGYYVNNASAWSLADPVKDGDYVNAFVYQDTKAFSDRYCYFDKAVADVNQGENPAFVLNGVYFDENYTAYSAPIAGAEITVNGEKTGIVTDEEGRFSGLTFAGQGVYTVSAVSSIETLVAPALTISYSVPKTSTSEPDTEVSEVSTVSETTEVASTADVTRGTVEGDLANPKSGDSSAVVFSAAALVISCGALLVIKKK